LATCRRLANLPPGKRGVTVAVLHRYLMVLASRLEDPTVPAGKVAAGPFVGPKAA
jgi:hypothetical protein